VLSGGRLVGWRRGRGGWCIKPQKEPMIFPIIEGFRVLMYLKVLWIKWGCMLRAKF
jgi:hypothetical protein